MNKQLRMNATAYLFMSPWLIGLFVFTLGPILASLYLSLTHYQLVDAPRWAGLDNFREIFLNDDRFVKSLKVTMLYVVLSVPLKLAFALLVAAMLNRNGRSMGLYRSVFYIPSLIGGSVAVAIMWRQIFGQDGVFNQLLGLLNLQGKAWLSHPDYALYTLVLLTVWQFGSPMIIFLAGLKQIPDHLYESASIDGASKRRQFFSITLPMLSPVLFFNLIMQTISSFMVFTQGYIITRGGPMDSTLFYALYLYEKGFTYFQMGYASALAWILLVMVGVCTALLFQSSKFWVHYES